MDISDIRRVNVQRYMKEHGLISERNTKTLMTYLLG